MAQKIDFKEITHIVRYGMLPRMKMVTPQKFNEMPLVDKLELYRSSFDIYHDICNYLSSALDIDKLNETYNQRVNGSDTFDPKDY